MATSTQEKLRRTSSAAAVTALTIGSLVLVNVIGQRLFKRADLTEADVYSLAEASKEVVSGLSDTLRVKAYFTASLPPPFSQNRDYLRDLLDEYRAFAKGKLRYEFMDPADDADLKKELERTGVPEVDVQVMRDDKFEAIKAYMGVALKYGDKTEVIPYVQNTDNLEYNLTSLMKRLTRERVPKLGIVRGHGEPDMQEQLGTAVSLINQQYETQEVDTTSGDEIPGEIDALLFVQPKTAFSEREVYVIDQFIMAGKPAAFLLDMVKTDMREFTAEPMAHGLDGLLGHYGAAPQAGLVLDMQASRINVSQRQGFMIINQALEYPFFPLLVRLDNKNLLTKDLANLSFPFVSNLELKDMGGDVKVTRLLETSARSWVVKENYPIHPYQLRESKPGTFTGPHALAATLEGKFKSYFADKPVPARGDEEPPAAPGRTESQPARVLVIADGDFVQSEFLNPRDRVKVVFFLNIVDWLLADEGLIAVRGKDVDERPLEEATAFEKGMVRWVPTLGVPLLFILFGVVRWRWREAVRRNVTL